MNKTLKTVIIILSVFFAVVILGVVFIDTLMRIFVPGLYLSSKVIKTADKFQAEESEMIKPPINIYGSHNITAEGRIADTDVSIKEGYNKERPFFYLSGTLPINENFVTLDLFLTDKSAGVRMPNVSDKYFTAPSDSFIEDWQNSIAGKVFPINGYPDVDLSLKKIKNTDNDPEWLKIGKELASDIKIKRVADAESNAVGKCYSVYVNGDALKNAVFEVLNSNKDNTPVNMLLKYFGNDILNIEDLADFVSGAEITGTPVIYMWINKNDVIIKAESEIETNMGTIKLWADCSQSEIMHNNLTAGLSIYDNADVYEAEYRINGNAVGGECDYESEISVSLPKLNGIKVINKYKGNIADLDTAHTISANNSEILDVRYNARYTDGVDINLKTLFISEKEMEISPGFNISLRSYSDENEPDISNSIELKSVTLNDIKDILLNNIGVLGNILK